MLLLEYKTKFEYLEELAEKAEKREQYLRYMGIYGDAKDRKREFWGQMHCKFRMSNNKVFGFSRMNWDKIFLAGHCKISKAKVEELTKKQREQSILHKLNLFLELRKKRENE